MSGNTRPILSDAPGAPYHTNANAPFSASGPGYQATAPSALTATTANSNPWRGPQYAARRADLHQQYAHKFSGQHLEFFLDKMLENESTYLADSTFKPIPGPLRKANPPGSGNMKANTVNPYMAHYGPQPVAHVPQQAQSYYQSLQYGHPQPVTAQRTQFAQYPSRPYLPQALPSLSYQFPSNPLPGATPTTQGLQRRTSEQWTPYGAAPPSNAVGMHRQQVASSANEASEMHQVNTFGVEDRENTDVKMDDYATADEMKEIPSDWQQLVKTLSESMPNFQNLLSPNHFADIDHGVGPAAYANESEQFIMQYTVYSIFRTVTSEGQLDGMTGGDPNRLFTSASSAVAADIIHAPVN